MSKVICGAIECRHNQNGKCAKKVLNFAAGNVMTVHEGRQDVWFCNMFELSDSAKELRDMLRSVLPCDTRN